MKAKKEEIAFNCACSIQRQLNVSDSDLCVVLGNALENAVEACEMMENTAARFISVESRVLNGQLLIKIENSYKGCLKLKDDGYFSTKSGEFHGIGLRNIHKVVENYGGFVKTEHNGKVFTLMAAFPNPRGTDGSRSQYPAK